MKLLFGIGLFVLGASAFCGPAEFVDGTLLAECQDTNSGLNFTYMDFENHLQVARGVSEPDLPAMMYSAYIDGRGNTSSIPSRSLEDRSLTTYWNVCQTLVSGVCANDNVPKWVSSLATFSLAVTAIVTQIRENDRANQSPRSICTNWKNQGTVCVSWAAYFVQKMTDQQIRDIADKCTNVCEEQNWSCESRVVTDNTVQYLCISDRASHCASNDQIRAC